LILASTMPPMVVSAPEVAPFRPMIMVESEIYHRRPNDN
jgi:hypothetical protein